MTPSDCNDNGKDAPMPPHTPSERATSLSVVSSDSSNCQSEASDASKSSADEGSSKESGSDGASDRTLAENHSNGNGNSSNASALLHFPFKLHKMLDDEGDDHIVGWSADGRSFVIRKRDEFLNEVLPKHFKQSRYKSFQRQLNLWGFDATRGGKRQQSVVSHPFFVQGKPELCVHITREKLRPRSERMVRAKTVLPQPSGAVPQSSVQPAQAAVGNQQQQRNQQPQQQLQRSLWEQLLALSQVQQPQQQQQQQQTQLQQNQATPQSALQLLQAQLLLLSQQLGPLGGLVLGQNSNTNPPLSAGSLPLGIQQTQVVQALLLQQQLQQQQTQQQLQNLQNLLTQQTPMQILQQLLKAIPLVASEPAPSPAPVAAPAASTSSAAIPFFPSPMPLNGQQPGVNAALLESFLGNGAAGPANGNNMMPMQPLQFPAFQGQQQQQQQVPSIQNMKMFSGF